MDQRRVIAYLTSSYARATDTFIRDEVEQLRQLGDRVVTYSVRKPPESEVVNDQIAQERARTTYLLDLPRSSFLTAPLALLVRSPRHFMRAARLAGELSRPGLRGRMWPAFYFLEATVLAIRLRREGIDHLHNHIGEGSASVALLASVLSGIPYSFTVHGPSEWDVPTEISLDLKARHAAFIATISEYTRGQTRRWIAHGDWNKVHVVRCGVRSHAAPEVEVLRGDGDGGPITLVSVGRLAHEKGHLVLLEALQQLDGSTRPRLVLVGDGPQRAELERFVRQAGDGLNVQFAGWQTTDQVHDILRAGTALVMPSFAEGLPVSIMEAFSLGKPVISSDVGGIAELVEQGRSGWLVAPGSVADLVDALRGLMNLTPAEREEMGAAGRARVRQQHDVGAEVALLRSLMHRAT